MMDRIKLSMIQSSGVSGITRTTAMKAGMLLLSFSMLLGACATVGKDFPVGRVYEIQIGETTQQDIREKFGHPWRVGVEDGQDTWTYGKYRYRLFGDASTKDLVIRFDNRKIVSSFTYNTTEHME